MSETLHESYLEHSEQKPKVNTANVVTVDIDWSKLGLNEDNKGGNFHCRRSDLIKRFHTGEAT